MARRGYKQTPEHIAKRIKRGEAHPNWLGDSVSTKGGRTRALRAYRPGACSRCESPHGERHHRDGDTTNNAPSNIEMLCRSCHMKEDGRLETFRRLDRRRGEDGRYVSR